MAKLRVSDIDKSGIVNESEPKILEISVGIESKEQFKFNADITDDEYELINWIISDVENIKAILTSAKRRRAKVGKSTKKKPE